MGFDCFDCKWFRGSEPHDSPFFEERIKCGYKVKHPAWLLRAELVVGYDYDKGIPRVVQVHFPDTGWSIPLSAIRCECFERRA